MHLSLTPSFTVHALHLIFTYTLDTLYNNYSQLFSLSHQQHKHPSAAYLQNGTLVASRSVTVVAAHHSTDSPKARLGQYCCRSGQDLLRHQVSIDVALIHSRSHTSYLLTILVIVPRPLLSCMATILVTIFLSRTQPFL